MSIGKNIRLLRVKYGLSQKDLALIVGVSTQAVSTWEQNIKIPRMGAIQKIADHFGLKKSDLIEDNTLANVSTSTIRPPYHTALTPSEETHIKKYRQLDADGKERIDRQIDFELYQLNRKAEEGAENCG